MKKLIAGLTLLSFSFTYAGIGNLLDNIVLGSYKRDAAKIESPNFTSYVGPSFSFRLNTSLLNKPIFSFQAPRMTLSCAGLDFDAGWLSLMNLDTLSQLLQQAGASFMWGVAVGLVYSLPGIAEAFDKLQKWGRFTQFLGQGACQAGIAAGRSIALAIRSNAERSAAESNIASGVSSTFTEAIKRIKENMEVNKLFGVYPYDVYYSSLSDKDMADLVASITGVFMFFPMDKNGNICTSQDCLGNLIRVKYLPPLSQISIKQIVSGGIGSVEVYDCDWGYINVAGTSIPFCKNASEGGLPTRTITINKGLKDMEYEYLKNITDKLKSGTPLTNREKVYIQTSPITNIIKLLNYAVLLEKMNKNDEKERLLQDLAYLSAILKVKSLLYSVRDNIAIYEGTYLSSKDIPDITAHIQYLDYNIEKADEYLDKKLISIEKATRAIETLEKGAEYLSKMFIKEFGITALYRD